MKNRLKYILVFLLLWINVSLYSRESTFHGLSVTEGLSDLVVNALYKDSLGYMWIGTGKALDRFDGVHVKQYQIPGADEKLKRVYAIAELPGNEIWMGNGLGLWRVSRKNDSLELIAPETIQGPVYSLLYDGKGILYIGTNKGLYIYRAGVLESVMVDANVLSTANTIYDMEFAPDGKLWMATEGGLCSMSVPDRSFTTYHYVVDQVHACRFVDMACIGSRLYLATQENGVMCFDIPTSSFSGYVDVGCNVISSLSTDGKYNLYVGTDGNGVHFIDTREHKVVRTFRYDSSRAGALRSNSVYSLLVDRDGLIWVGYYQHGLDYTLYQNGLFSVYACPPFFDTRNMPIRSLLIRGHEKLIGSRDGLFFVDEKNRRFKSFKIPQLRSNMIFCSQYYQGEYYVGTYGGGMYVLNPANGTIRDFDALGAMPFSQGHIFCMKEDSEGNLWIGTSQGIYCYKGQELKGHYTSANSRLPAGNVYEIFFDSTHKGWICTENGLCIWDPSTQALRTDGFPDGFIHKEKIRVVYEDSKHQLYFFPDKGNLFVSNLSMTSYHYQYLGTALEGKDGLCIVEDSEGWLWLGTNNGLFRYDKEQKIIPYHFTDGIPSPIFTLCPPVCDEEGHLWFANSQGLLQLDLNELKRHEKTPYPVLITDVQENGLSSVTFRFSDFSYTLALSVAYEYQLEGKDTAWMGLLGHSEVTYYDLKEGDYTFKVRRMGEPHTETATSLHIESSVSVGWWSLNGLVFLMLAGLGWLVYHKKIKKENRPSKQEDQVVTEEKEVGQKTEVEKYKTIRISKEDCERMIKDLENYMKTAKPYANPNLKVGDLAKAIGVSSHNLSYLFNQYLKCSYYDYINDYRVAEFKHLVKSGEYRKYTLSALAEICGFNSRASFFRSFKKVTGVTPNEYISSKEQ